MIEGLKVRLSGRELITLCRVTADRLRAEAAGNEAEPCDLYDGIMDMMAFTATLELRNFRNKRAIAKRQEAQRLEAFAFRVAATEEYLLSPSELDQFYEQPHIYNPNPVNFAPDAAFPDTGAGAAA